MAVYCLTLILICCALNELAIGSPYSTRESEQDISSHEAADVHIRRKRHIAEHLITDRRLKQVRAKERSIAVNKLIQLASPDLCRCKTSRNAIDDRSRSREKLAKSLGSQSRGCTCDMPFILRQLYKRMLRGGKKNNGNDSLSKYLSTLDNRRKMILRHVLQHKLLRLRLDNLRKERRANRRAVKRRDPYRVLHGVNLFLG